LSDQYKSIGVAQILSCDFATRCSKLAWTRERAVCQRREVLLTKEGLSRLEDELEHLKTVKRREVADRIKQALAFGDISENAEYDDAKNEQAFVEGRIAMLEKDAAQCPADQRG
jgi:hypothetical protein